MTTSDIVPSGSPFDYDALDMETRIMLRQATSDIKDIVRKTAQDIITIGSKLNDIKARLDYGLFTDWVAVEFDGCHSTALRLMRVAKRVSCKLEQFSFSSLDNFGIAALCELCAPSAPKGALDVAFHLAEAGTEINRSLVRGLISGQSPNFLLYLSEATLEELLAERLKKEGTRHQRQVDCPVGRADIVTPDAIYEIKHPIDREGLFKAVGQVLLYRSCINPTARAVVVFVAPESNEFDSYIRATEAAGVEVLLWK